MRPFMTEEEAAEKWCPMVRLATKGFGNPNRDQDRSRGFEYRCIASECMWWGWEETLDDPTDTICPPKRRGRCEVPAGS